MEPNNSTIIQSALLQRPPHGHCLVLNYDPSFDTQSAVESFTELNFHCQLYNELMSKLKRYSLKNRKSTGQHATVWLFVYLLVVKMEACQGSNVDPGILVSDTRADVSQEIPFYNQPDWFVFSSSYPGHYSYRDTNGSWFIQSLCEVLQKHHSHYDLTTIATIVCRRVAYRADCELQQLKQIPFFHCTLTRPIAFVTCYPLK